MTSPLDKAGLEAAAPAIDRLTWEKAERGLRPGADEEAQAAVTAYFSALPAAGTIEFRVTDENNGVDYTETRTLAASPTPPAAGPVGIKPLEWRVMTRTLNGAATWRCDSIVGRYTVIDSMGWGPEPANEVWHCIDDDAAKARCQADYEHRILSALESDHD